MVEVGAAGHIIAQVCRWQGRRVFAFTRAGDGAGQAFARSMGAEWPDYPDAEAVWNELADLCPNWNGIRYDRLEEQGRISAAWQTSENNRQAKYYALTSKGRRQLAHEKENWIRLSAAVASIVGA